MRNIIAYNFPYFLLLLLVWIISPFIGIFFAIAILTLIKVDSGSLKIVCFFISLSFALLAFTQKSLYWDGTDIERYYYDLAPLVKLDSRVIPIVLASDILTYVFTPINVIVVVATKNVQSISIVWIFIIYYLLFLAIINYIELYHKSILNNKRFLTLTILFIIFGSVLFTQVTETIKSAVAFSLFWYTFTLYLKGINKIYIVLLSFIGVGIHPQTLMFLPIYLYQRFNYKYLFIAAIITVILSIRINIIEVVLSILPSGGWFDMLKERAFGYGMASGESSSKRYIFIGLLCLFTSLFIYKEKIYTQENKTGNIILIYSIIMFLNFNISDAFIRFANFISYIATIEFIDLYCRKRTRQISYLFTIIFMVLNLQMTLGRTIGGGYCSSYMDNSISKMLFSNVYDYITYKAYP